MSNCTNSEVFFSDPPYPLEWADWLLAKSGVYGWWNDWVILRYCYKCYIVCAAWCLISWSICGTGLGCFPITHLSHEWQRRTYQDLWCVLHHPPFRLAFTGLLGRISWKEDRAEIPLKFGHFPEFVEKLELKPQCVTTNILNPIKD